MTRLVWYRNDLRVQHLGLRDALDSGEPVAALYLLCPGQWDRHQVAPGRRWYVLESLRELGRKLAGLGVPLYILDADDFHGAVERLSEFVPANRITAVHYTIEYPLNERRRDDAVARRLGSMGVRFSGRDESMILPPDAVRTGKGTPYTVFTPYLRAWRRALEQNPPSLANEPDIRPARSFADESVIDEALHQLQVPDGVREAWTPGEDAAIRQLRDFVAEGLPDYHRQRDFPARPGTSGLSAALSAGTLSPARAWWEATEAGMDPRTREGATAWISELAWRDFYRQICHHFPVLSRGKAFRPEEAWLEWHFDEGLWQAWCRGETGYPLVDAAMRQLVQTGWMHNRLRMLVAMFLTKDLNIDWRRGERFFMAHLVDGDFAANNGGWQWSASVGTDAVPYFRVFNPVRQSRRFDPEGRFIARFVPELAELDNKAIHEPWTQPLLAGNYPPPVVDHRGVKERVSQAFRFARQRLEEETE